MAASVTGSPSTGCTPTLGPGQWRRPDTGLEEFARLLAGAGTVVRGRATDNGQKILIGRRLLVVDDGKDTLRGLVTQTDLDEAVADILRRPR